MSTREKMYSLAFRKRHDDEDFFYINEDYCFEEYKIDCMGRYWLADPFLFERDGKVYVFYEAYDLAQQIGKLGYSILDPDTKTLTPPHIILERSYHFSWPYIFERDGEIYIMPETIGDYRVRLFRAESFPDVWVEDEVLVNDIYTADSIFIELGGREYLLTSEHYHNTPNGEYASCRVKNVLFEFMPGRKFMLKPNGKINPEGKIVAEGDYGVRNAGKVFRSQGELIRPGQDSKNKPDLNMPPYGRGVVLFRVKSMEPYEEEEIFSVDCDSIGEHLKTISGEKVIGLHTYNASEHFEVIDFAQIRDLPVKTRMLRKAMMLRKIVAKIRKHLLR